MEIRTIPYPNGELRLFEVRTNKGNLKYELKLEKSTGTELGRVRWYSLSEALNLEHSSHDPVYLSPQIGVQNAAQIHVLGWFYDSWILSPSQPFALYFKDDRFPAVKEAAGRMMNRLAFTEPPKVQTYGIGLKRESLLFIEPGHTYPNTLARRYGSSTAFLQLQRQLMQELTDHPETVALNFDWFNSKLTTFLTRYWEAPFPKLLEDAAVHETFSNRMTYHWLAALISGCPLDSCLQLTPEKL